MKSVIIIFIGFFLLIKGAEILVSGATGIARKFNISEIIIGVTIVSIGTSLPELMISVQSALRGIDDISIGNVLGSCICNILLILGISSLFHSIEIDKESKKTIIPLNIISIILVFLFGNINMQISKVEGIMLLGVFMIFILYIIKSQKEDSKDNVKTDINDISNEDLLNIETTKIKKNNENKEIKDEKLWKSIIYIIIGMIGLKYGGDFVVDSGSELAKILNISDDIIGLTVVSIGTSLPELVTSIIAVRAGKEQIAFGNVVGSNLFNLLLVLGTTSVIRPINYSAEFNSTLIILLLITSLICIFDKIGNKSKIEGRKGFAMLLIYIEYITMLVTSQFNNI